MSSGVVAHICIPSSVTEMGIAVSLLPGEILYSDALSVAATENTNQLFWKRNVRWLG